MSHSKLTISLPNDSDRLIARINSLLATTSGLKRTLALSGHPDHMVCFFSPDIRSVQRRFAQCVMVARSWKAFVTGRGMDAQNWKRVARMRRNDERLREFKRRVDEVVVIAKLRIDAEEAAEQGGL